MSSISFLLAKWLPFPTLPLSSFNEERQTGHALPHPIPHTFLFSEVFEPISHQSLHRKIYKRTTTLSTNDVSNESFPIADSQRDFTSRSAGSKTKKRQEGGERISEGEDKEGEEGRRGEVAKSTYPPLSLIVLFSSLVYLACTFSLSI